MSDRKITKDTVDTDYIEDGIAYATIRRLDLIALNEKIESLESVRTAFRKLQYRTQNYIYDRVLEEHDKKWPERG